MRTLRDVSAAVVAGFDLLQTIGPEHLLPPNNGAVGLRPCGRLSQSITTQGSRTSLAVKGVKVTVFNPKPEKVHEQRRKTGP